MTKRIRIEDAQTEGGGVARLIVKDQSVPLIRRELEIVDAASDKYISATGWVPGRSVVQFEAQEVKEGDLHILIDGPIVSEVLNEYDPILITIPELELSEDHRWPWVIANYTGNAISQTQTRIVPVDGPPEPVRTQDQNDARRQHQQVDPPEEEEEIIIGDPPPPPIEKSRWRFIVPAIALVAGSVLGFAANEFLKQAENDADLARIAELEDALRLAQQDLSDEQAKSSQLQIDLGAKEDEIAGFETLMTLSPVDDVAADLLPDGNFGDINDYLDGQPISNPPDVRLYSTFFALYSERVPGDTRNMPEPASAEELFLLRSAVSFGSVPAMLALGIHMRDHVTPTRESLETARLLFGQAAFNLELEGNTEDAEIAQNLADQIFLEHRALLLSQD
jgi:hypothetical protein